MTDQLDYRICSLVSRGVPLKKAKKMILGSEKEAATEEEAPNPNPYAFANGWARHPESSDHVFKGTEVITLVELEAKEAEWNAENAA